MKARIIVATILFVAVACTRSSLENETADLKVKVRELERAAESFKTAKEAAERDAAEWRERSGALEKQLEALKPEALPPFKPSDLNNNEVVLQRVYSIRTGRCFSEAGDSSCLYLRLKEEHGVAFVVYKANRLFPKSAKLPSLHNDYGQPLSVVTGDIARAILAWEKENGNRQIGLEGY